MPAIHIFNGARRHVVKAKGVSAVVYEPTLFAPEFFGSEVPHDPEAFKADCDVIAANH